MADARSEWVPFLSGLADREDRRKSALETRATGIATISAAVIAILTAGSVIGARVGITIPDWAVTTVAIALLLFLGSIVCSIAVNLPIRLRQTDPAGLLDQVRGSAVRQEASAWTTIAATHIAEYRSLCEANRIKAITLWIGLACQIFGCLALAVFVTFTL